MALDSKLTQNINLRVANSDQLLQPLTAFGREINKIISQLGTLSTSMEAGGKNNEKTLRTQVQILQRLVGEASTLQNLLTSSNRKRGDSLLSPLDEQALGKRTAAAARMSQGIQDATRASDALFGRLVQVRKEFAALNEAGRSPAKRNLEKEFNIESALVGVKKLETAMKRLSATPSRQTGSGPAIRDQYDQQYAALLAAAKNGNRSKFDAQLAALGNTVDEYRAAPKADTQQAAIAARAARKQQADDNAEQKRLQDERIRLEGEGQRRLDAMRLEEVNAQLQFGEMLAAEERARLKQEQAYLEERVRLEGEGQRRLDQMRFAEIDAQLKFGEQLAVEETNRLKAEQARIEERIRLEGEGQRRLDAIRKEELDSQIRYGEQLATEENARQRAMFASRQQAQKTVSQSDPMLRAQLERGASQFKFTPEQARGFDMTQLGKDIDGNVQRLARLKEAMARALEQGRGQAVLDRLNQSYQGISATISEIIAKQRAVGALPENRMAAITELFKAGGLEFGKRALLTGAVTTGVFALLNGLQTGVRNVLEFEDALKQLQAISGSTNTEMETLGASIVAIADNSKYSTVEITKAATTIAQAGFSAAETADVLKNALNLATASGSSPEQSVETLTSTLGAFQLQASESGHVVDVLVAGLNRSKLSIEQMQAAIQYAGATAHESGVSFEELTATTALLADAGIRSGSTIGTGLRQIMVDMKEPTKEFKKELADLGLTMADVDVKSKGLAGVVKTLRDAGFGAEAAYASFEVRAASAFLALSGQIDGYDEMSQALQQSGAAAQAADVAMESLSAKSQVLLNNLLALASALAAPFLDALKAVVDGINGVFKGIGELADAFPGLTQSSSEFSKVLASTAELALAGFAVGGPFGAVIGGLLGFAGAIGNSREELDALQAATNQASAKLKAQEQTVSSVDEAINQLISRHETLTEDTTALQTETLTLSDRFEGLSTHLVKAKDDYQGLLDAMLAYRGEALKQAAVDATSTGLAAQDERNGLVKQLHANTDRAKLAINVPGQTPDQVAASLRPQAQAAYRATSSIDLSLDGRIAIQSAINELQKQKDLSGTEKDILSVLKERLNLVSQAAAAQAKIDSSRQVVDRYNDLNSSEGVRRNNVLLGVRQGINDGLTKNQQSRDSGDALLTQTVARAKAEIKRLTDELGKVKKGSAQYLDINEAIRDLQNEVSRVGRAQRIQDDEDAKEHPERAQGGTVLPAAKVASALQKEFPGIVISFARQRTPADGAIYNPGSLHAKPGGNAIDVSKLPEGVDPDQIIAALESMGLYVPRNANGFLDEFKHPSAHATGGHYHFGWTAKPSSYSQDMDRQGRRDANAEDRSDQKQAVNAASQAVEAQRAAITNIMSQARAGTTPILDMKKALDEAIDAYTKASLNEFDVKNPTEGLSKDALASREAARKSLEEKLRQDAAKYHEDLFKQISDDASKTFAAAQKSIQEQLDREIYAAQADARSAKSQTATSQNRRNASNVGTGTAYILQRNEEQAQLRSDRAVLALRQQADAASASKLADFRLSTASLDPNSEAGKTNAADLAAKQKALNDEMQKTADLQTSINERTAEFSQLPLIDRIKGSIEAWADASGAMDSFGKQIENNIGPMLDSLTDGFAKMFESVATGARTWKQALGDMISTFAKFVMQIILKALALQAVKAILGAFGFQLTKSDVGTTITAKGSYNGGMVEVPGRFLGGPIGRIEGGGTVDRGVSNRDSALYNLARGEYVVRGQSVASIGKPAMDLINQHGAKGLAKLGAAGSAFTSIQAPKQETNVWVVKPDSQPSMGPKDVLITIADDILQGGSTKRLIRQVAQGG